jgi:sigma-B regulation protein RsbU (phosphoserine phosphatase)
MENIKLNEIRNQLVDRKSRIEKVITYTIEKSQFVNLLMEVDSALERIATGTYGICEVCKDSIEEERLKVDPLTRFCLDHLTSTQQQILEQDFTLASNIQKALLPKNKFTSNGWEIHYSYEPAGPVSGDYCDILEDKSNGSKYLFFIVGDVSGKGFAASMLMTHMHAMFHSLLPFGLTVNELMGRANRLLCESTLSSHYATLVCIKADESGNIEICNAGHFHPLIIRREKVEKIDSTGFPLGLFCSGQYSNYKTQLKSNEVIFLYTDGLIEARKGDQEYGIDRLIEKLHSKTKLAPQELNEYVLKDLNEFTAGLERLDDLTIMTVKKK